MAFDAFLKLDGIDGESVDEKHKGEIEILSFSWGATNSGSHSSGGGGGAGKVSFQDLHFVSSTQQSSPSLMLACASGKHIKYAVLSLRKAGGRGSAEWIKVSLSDVLVSSFQQAGDPQGGEGSPSEAMSLNFSKIEFEYSPQKADGSTGTPTRASWDLKSNTGA